MKIFISYKFTGEDFDQLKNTLSKITGVIEQSGYSVYCSITDEMLYREKSYSVKQIFDHALTQLETCDAVLAYVNSNNRSEGQLIEVGYALHKKMPIVLAYKRGVNVNSSKAVADQVIEYETLADLLEKLKYLKVLPQ